MGGTAGPDGVSSRVFVTMLRTLCLLAAIALWPVAALADRVALVIGNASYEAGALRTAARDADSMAAALRSKGFEVLQLRDASREEMLGAVDEFQRRIRAGGIAVAYYSGHAVALNGENWLLPVANSEIATPGDAMVQSVSVNDLVRVFDQSSADLSLLILDASRESPLPPSVGVQHRGLAPMEPGDRTWIVYSAEPGTVAVDGTNENSPFTAALIAELEQAGRPLADVLWMASGRTGMLTAGQQVPWIVAPLIRMPERWLNDGDVSIPTPPQAPRKPIVIDTPIDWTTQLAAWGLGGAGGLLLLRIVIGIRQGRWTPSSREPLVMVLACFAWLGLWLALLVAR